SRSALPRRADRRVVDARGWSCDHDDVERRSLDRAACTAAHRLTWRAALLLDRELLLADHLGPFTGLGLDVIGELLRRARHRLEHLRRKEFFAELRIGQDLRDFGVDFGYDLAWRAGGVGPPRPGR